MRAMLAVIVDLPAIFAPALVALWLAWPPHSTSVRSTA